MLFPKSFISQKVGSLLFNFNKTLSGSHGFNVIRTLKTDNLSSKTQGEKKGNFHERLIDELPHLVGPHDEDFSKCLWTLMKHPTLLKYSARNFVDECKKYVEMRKEEIREDYSLHDPVNHVNMLYTFEKQEDVDRFLVRSDRDNNTGNSYGSLTLTQEKTALFSGYINTEPLKTGNAKVAGIVNMLGPRKKKGFRMRGRFNWTKYTHLVFKIRGDGRSYLIVLTAPQYYDELRGMMYAQPLYTRGGPYWQIAKVPFSHFYFLQKGRMTDSQNCSIHLDSIGNLGITAAGFDGHFRLEIDYIGLEFNPFHNRQTPYEEYTKDF